MRLQNDYYCFACGTKNPQGLKLKFQMENNILSAKFIPQKVHQGYKDVTHGGIISTILDELMAQFLILKKEIHPLTVKMEIKFKKMAEIGEELVFKAKFLGIRAKFFKLKAWVDNSKEEIIAEALGIFVDSEAL